MIVDGAHDGLDLIRALVRARGVLGRERPQLRVGVLGGLPLEAQGQVALPVT